MVFGTLQDALNKHGPAVTHASQRRPQGAPAAPLNLFGYLMADLPYFNLNHCPTGDAAIFLNGFNTATTPQQGPLLQEIEPI